MGKYIPKFNQDLRSNKYVDLANCRSNDQKHQYQQILEEGYDPFETVERIKKLGNEVVYENKNWIAFQNQHYTDRKNHFVVIAKRFVTEPSELQIAEKFDLFEAYEDLTNMYDILGGMLVMRFGDTRLSGASVKHLHFHIVEPNPNTSIPMFVGCKIDSK